MEFDVQHFLPDDQDRPLTMSATVDSVLLLATLTDFKLWPVIAMVAGAVSAVVMAYYNDDDNNVDHNQSLIRTE